MGLEQIVEDNLSKVIVNLKEMANLTLELRNQIWSISNVTQSCSTFSRDTPDGSYNDWRPGMAHRAWEDFSNVVRDATGFRSGGGFHLQVSPLKLGSHNTEIKARGGRKFGNNVRYDAWNSIM